MKQPEEMTYEELCAAGIINFYAVRSLSMLREYEERLKTGERMIDIELSLVDKYNVAQETVHKAIYKARKALRG